MHAPHAKGTLAFHAFIRSVLAATIISLPASPALAQKASDVFDLLNKAASKAQKPAPTSPNSTPPSNAPSDPKPDAARTSPASSGTIIEPTSARPHARYTLAGDGAEITDSQTGLIWRRCAEGMTWNNATCTGEATPFSSLQNVFRHARREVERTKGGWRVPTHEELKTLINVHTDHPNRGDAGIDKFAFPATPKTGFWSATLYYKERGDRDRTKIVHFANGFDGYLDNGEFGALRLVRNASGNNAAAGETIPIEKSVENREIGNGPRFVPSANGQEVKDNKTGLIWRRCAEGMVAKGGGCSGTAATYNFDDAQKRALSQAKLAKPAWRMPTSVELKTITDESRFKLAIDTTAFPGTPPEHFWTSNREDAQNGKAIHFYNGFVYSRYHTSPHHVRLVRDEK